MAAPMGRHVLCRVLRNIRLKETDFIRTCHNYGSCHLLSSQNHSRQSFSQQYFSSCRNPSMKTTLIRQPSNTGLHVLSREMCYQSRDVNIQPLEKVDFYFDTHALIKNLQDSGYSEMQAECLSKMLVTIINRTMEIQQKNSVTKAQQEIMLQQIMTHIAAVKKDMVILEKSEFSALRNENEKLTIQVKQLRENLKDEIIKVKGHVSLDLNLERGRAKEVEAEQSKKIDFIGNRIDTEVAYIKALMEANKNDVLKYMGGTIVGCLGVVLTFWRLFML